MTNNVGIMQGRLSEPINKKIQAFPKDSWKEEFLIAKDIGFELIEWVFDCMSNPIFKDEGIKEIKYLSKKYGIKINSLCADYFMKNLLFRNSKERIKRNVDSLTNLIQQCYKTEIKIVELPFVDSSSLENYDRIEEIQRNLEPALKIAQDCNIILALESDLEPDLFCKLLEKFNHPNLKANYDVGNSTSKGYNVEKELTVLKKWIVNIHVKDRLRHKDTVPFGEGDVDFKKFFQKLSKIQYSKDLIIQGAREDLEENIPVKNTCSKYLRFVNKFLQNNKK